ncbi:MAG: heavy-metal-associated domain-containing protein [Trueperaceae bacterium]
MARVILGIKGMTTMEAAEKVWETLMSIEGVEKVDVGREQQATVEYDAGSLTVMDFIRALRKIGFLAGME